MKIYKWVLLWLIVIVHTGCDRYLDVKPKGKDIASTIEHYNGLFNSNTINTTLNFRRTPVDATGESSIIPLGYADLPIYMADDVLSEDPYFSSMPLTTQKAMLWQGDIYQPDADAAEWGYPYVRNYVFNVVANGVMDAEGGTEERKKQLLAEARANRAYMHFMAVRHFGKPYNAATAATDPGVPIVTKAEIGNLQYARSSVQEVYDFAVKELTEAIPDLPARTESNLRLGKTAAFYLLGEVYLNMREYAKALEQFKLALENLPNSSITIDWNDYNVMAGSWYNASRPERGLSGFPGGSASKEVMFLMQQSNIDAVIYAYVYMAPEVLALYGSHDLRRLHFSDKSRSNATITLPGYRRASPTSENYGPGMAGLYLYLAETKARTGDLEGARKDLETLRSHRMPAVDATVTASTANELIRFIFDEREREYAGTGVRWFDMRRLSVDPDFKNLIRTTRTIAGKTVQLAPERLTLKIPPKILQFNPGMQLNP